MLKRAAGASTLETFDDAVNSRKPVSGLEVDAILRTLVGVSMDHHRAQE
jgi:hypothetical protein